MLAVTAKRPTSPLGLALLFEGENAEQRRQNATDSINEGAADSFWENYEEFEPGIENAKKFVADGLFPSFRDALFEVFGHFQFRFEINGTVLALTRFDKYSDLCDEWIIKRCRQFYITCDLKSSRYFISVSRGVLWKICTTLSKTISPIPG